MIAGTRGMGVGMAMCSIGVGVGMGVLMSVGVHFHGSETSAIGLIEAVESQTILDYAHETRNVRIERHFDSFENGGCEDGIQGGSPPLIRGSLRPRVAVIKSTCAGSYAT